MFKQVWDWVKSFGTKSTDKQELWMQCQSELFVCDGEAQLIEVINQARIRRCRAGDKEVLEEIVLPISPLGSGIFEVGVSPNGEWAVTVRYSGQGEWGYDVLRCRPLERVAGIDDESGYQVELPRFAADNSFLVGGAGDGFLGEWWSPADALDSYEPASGGQVSLGYIFVHQLPSHHVSRHELVVELPSGWLPDDPEDDWFGPQEITPTPQGVNMITWWGVPVEVPWPLPDVIQLPTPHPSGTGVI